MRIAKKLAGSLVFIILIVSSSVGASSVDFNGTTVEIDFVEDDYLSSSIDVTLGNVPDLSGYNFELEVGELLSNQFDTSTTVDFSDNIITSSDTLKLYLVKDQSRIEVFSHSIETGVYLHLRHVYSNWTAGQPPPPDKRGLGIGAMLDLEILSGAIPDQFSTTEEATSLGEQILNLLLDDQIDRNQDGNIETLSDGFGTLEYIYGMRDHISNAGNSQDATQEIFDLAVEINTNLSSSIIEAGNYGTYLTRLNDSTASTALLYQNALELLSTGLSNANNLLGDIEEIVNTEVLPIVSHNFNRFRNFVYGIDQTFDQVIELPDINPSSTASTTNDTPYGFVIGFVTLMQVFPLLRKKSRLVSI